MAALVVVAMVAAGAGACTSDGDQDQAADELPVEVEGEVLDRRDPPAEDVEEAEGADDADDADEAAGADAEGGDADDAEADDDAPAATTSPAPTSPAPTSPAPTSPAPTSPAPTAPAPTSPAPTTPAPAPAEPAPTPVATPAPRVLAAGPAQATGPVLDSDGVDWTVSSSTTIERGAQPPALTVATRPGDDAPRRQVACAASLEAPSDRGLVARGTLTVSLRVVGADGTVQVLPRQRIELDVTLEPGRRLDLAVSPGRTVDVADVRQVTCVADLVG